MSRRVLRLLLIRDVPKAQLSRCQPWAGTLGLQSEDLVAETAHIPKDAARVKRRDVPSSACRSVCKRDRPQAH